MFDKKIKPGTHEGEKLQAVLLLIKQCEDINYPVPFPNAIDAIKIMRGERGLKNKDLVGKVGSKGYVSARNDLTGKQKVLFRGPQPPGHRRP